MRSVRMEDAGGGGASWGGGKDVVAPKQERERRGEDTCLPAYLARVCTWLLGSLMVLCSVWVPGSLPAWLV
jgi:hypothetical protein